MKKVAFVITGCGHLEGSDPSEVSLTALALDLAQAEYQFFGLDAPVITHNHNTEEVQRDERNRLVEAARITRGNITAVSQMTMSQFEALIICGRLPEDTAEWSKPLKIFREDLKPIVTVGNCGAQVARVLQSLDPGGEQVHFATHSESDLADGGEICPNDDYITDRENRLISTSGLSDSLDLVNVQKGIQGAIKEALEMA